MFEFRPELVDDDDEEADDTKYAEEEDDDLIPEVTHNRIYKSILNRLIYALI